MRSLVIGALAVSLLASASGVRAQAPPPPLTGDDAQVADAFRALITGLYRGEALVEANTRLGDTAFLVGPVGPRAYLPMNGRVLYHLGEAWPEYDLAFRDLEARAWGDMGYAACRMASPRCNGASEMEALDEARLLGVFVRSGGAWKHVAVAVIPQCTDPAKAVPSIRAAVETGNVTLLWTLEVIFEKWAEGKVGGLGVGENDEGRVCVVPGAGQPPVIYTADKFLFRAIEEHLRPLKLSAERDEVKIVGPTVAFVAANVTMEDPASPQRLRMAMILAQGPERWADWSVVCTVLAVLPGPATPPPAAQAGK